MKTKIKLLFFLGLGNFHSIWYFAVDSGISTQKRPTSIWGKILKKPIQAIFKIIIIIMLTRWVNQGWNFLHIAIVFILSLSSVFWLIGPFFITICNSREGNTLRRKLPALLRALRALSGANCHLGKFHRIWPLFYWVSSKGPGPGGVRTPEMRCFISSLQ